MAGNGLDENCGLVRGDRSGEGRGVVGVTPGWADRFNGVKNDVE